MKRQLQGSRGLFDRAPEPVILPLQDAVLHYFPAAFAPDEADALLQSCMGSLAWRQDSLRIAGRLIPIPRLQCWYGDAGAQYGYSRLRLSPLPWSRELLFIKSRVESCSGHRFNAVLANYYRDGQDSVDWHSDDEPELGPVIASVSLGAVRCFEMKHRYQRELKKLKLPLTHGSLLLMTGETQHYWRHRVPKEPAIAQARINLTFRQISPCRKA
ncbi:MAG: alpha-ketoglutarate-dependent dioxygenase AlkB [Pseudomonadales bacterium]|nr:alpha-ketoglutarate-dependent dioxygenase AlkB [Pseudomonadales bacterium]MCP5331515.1 alpha-ketoglutarate-dependent dioxygenase AlkB [Pseudomonadales bacterium]MCP5343398.1 alpha-ketoglutarate-dependent dioxygenase AlkB [Pseudomonadales bacterium]